MNITAGKIKRFITGIAFTYLSLFCFAKELEGTDLKIFNMASDARLFCYDYEELDEQLEYLNKIENQIAAYDSETSEEAKLLCEFIMFNQKRNVVAEEMIKKQAAAGQKRHKKEKKNEEDDEELKWYKTLEAFSASHENLSSYFYFQLLNAKTATFAYMSMSKQLKAIMEMFEGYGQIENETPDNSENLFTKASFLYFMPKIAGGDKKLAAEKIQHAIKTAANDYEKVSSLILYSQFLVEDKKLDEAKIYFDQAKKIAPNNRTLLKLEKLNAEGHSMFDEEAYKNN